MKYRVKIKTTVTAWVEVELPTDGFDEQGAHEWAADHAVTVEEGEFREFLAMAQEHAPGVMDVEYGPIELAHEELDESVKVVA